MRDGGNGKNDRSKSTRFQPGQSGNPKGRPPNRHREDLPYETVLGGQTTITVRGERREVTREVAFLFYMYEKGLKGSSAIARDMIDAIEKTRRQRGLDGFVIKRAYIISHGFHDWRNPKPLTGRITSLRMAKEIATRATEGCIKLEPWIVQAALDRFGDRRLSHEEQDRVVAVTRTPHKVNWPDWWERRPPGWRKAA